MRSRLCGNQVGLSVSNNSHLGLLMRLLGYISGSVHLWRGWCLLLRLLLQILNTRGQVTDRWACWLATLATVRYHWWWRLTWACWTLDLWNLSRYTYNKYQIADFEILGWA